MQAVVRQEHCANTAAYCMVAALAPAATSNSQHHATIRLTSKNLSVLIAFVSSAHRHTVTEIDTVRVNQTRSLVAAAVALADSVKQSPPLRGYVECILLKVRFCFGSPEGEQVWQGLLLAERG